MIKNSLHILFYFILPFYCQAQKELNYNSFIEAVRLNSPLSEKAINNIDYAKAQYIAAKGNYDPSLSTDLSNKYFGSKQYFTVGEVELKQPVLSSHYLKMGYQYGQGIYLNPENKMPLSGLSYVGVEANILQGLFIDKRRTELIKARHYVDYYNAEETIQMNDLFYTSSNSYFEYLFVRKLNSLYVYFEKLAQERLSAISELSMLGEKPLIDTIEASIFLQSRKLDKQASEIDLLKMRAQTNVFLANNSSDTYLVSDSIDLIYELCNKKLLSTLLLENKNPILTQYDAKQKILNTEYRYKKEMIKPILKLNYNFLSTATNNDWFYLNSNNYKWGASFSMPLYLRKPRNEYKMALISAENNLMELKNKQNEIFIKRNFIIQSIEMTAKQINNAKQAVNYNKILVEAERLKFENGESSLFLLNARESKWLEAELKLLDYKLKYIKTFFDLIYINGDLKYGFDI